MLNIGRKLTFLPVSRDQYFSNNLEGVKWFTWVTPNLHKNLGGLFGDGLSSISNRQPLVTCVRRSDIRKSTQVMVEEFLPMPASYVFTKNYPQIDISQSTTSYFLRTDGMKYLDDTIFFPTEPNDSVLVVKQEKLYPPIVVSIEGVFNELYAQWREQIKFKSFIGNSIDLYHEKIVQLGYGAVPFIIKKLRTESAHLFIALNRITGKNPVKKENMGKVSKMAEDWIKWWDERIHEMG